MLQSDLSRSGLRVSLVVRPRLLCNLQSGRLSSAFRSIVDEWIQRHGRLSITEGCLSARGSTIMLDVGICYTWYDVGEQLRPQLPFSRPHHYCRARTRTTESCLNRICPYCHHMEEILWSSRVITGKFLKSTFIARRSCWNQNESGPPRKSKQWGTHDSK